MSYSSSSFRFTPEETSFTSTFMAVLRTFPVGTDTWILGFAIGFEAGVAATYKLSLIKTTVLQFLSVNRD